jgi:hypothetical protein
MKHSFETRQVHISRNKKQDDFFKSLFCFWSLILTLLGLPWVIGYLMIDNERNILFSYLFTILNSSQGTFVFIFHCLVSKSVRQELLKGLYRQTNKLLSNLDKTNEDGGYSSRSKSPIFDSLKRGPSNSSSFRISKKLDSTKLLRHKSSNCSSTNRSDSITNQNKSGFKRVLDFFHNLLFCFCLKSPPSSASSLSYSTSLDLNRQSYTGKNGKSSMTPSSSRITNECAQSPIHNFSFGNANTMSRANNNNNNANNHQATYFNDDACPNNMLPNDTYYNTSNKLNEINSNTLSSSHESNSELVKQAVPPMYFANDTSSTINSSASVVGNFFQTALNNQSGGTMQRNFSHYSNSMEHKNQYIAPVTCFPESNTNTYNRYNTNTLKSTTNSVGQVPTVPPPPPPPLIYNNFYGLDIPISGGSQLKSKDNQLNEPSRFSTFKGSFKDSSAQNNNNLASFNSFKSSLNYKNSILASRTVNRTPSTLTTNTTTPVRRQHGNYDENQYLTPEYHSYSMVDSELQSDNQYYCEDGVGFEDDLSNNYVEVMDEFVFDSELSYANVNNKKVTDTKNYKLISTCLTKCNSSSANKTSGGSVKQSKQSKFKNKLKDLISMPEEFDKDDSIENSNASDHDLFDMTSIKKDTLKRKNVSKIPSSLSNTSSPSSASSSIALNSSLENQQINEIMHLSPNENSKAKKILQRL